MPVSLTQNPPNEENAPRYALAKFSWKGGLSISISTTSEHHLTGGRWHNVASGGWPFPLSRAWITLSAEFPMMIRLDVVI